MRIWRGVLLAWMVLALPVAARAESRVALVIGNADYATVVRLHTPANDAKLVAAALRRAGFAVDLRINANRWAFRRALATFAVAAAGADIALIYYAGHGLEAQGSNYLIPVDARLAVASDLAFEAWSLQSVLDAVGGTQGLKLVVIDAGRDRPFRDGQGIPKGPAPDSISPAPGRGLAQVETYNGPNTVIAFSAAPGRSADDGTGANSPFANAFAHRIVEPDVDVLQAFRNIRSDVFSATGGGQETSYSSTLSRDFYIVPWRMARRPSGVRLATATAVLREASGTRLVATAGPDGVARVYRGAELIGTVRGHAAAIDRVAFVAGGAALMTADAAGATQVTRLDSIAARGAPAFDRVLDALARGAQSLVASALGFFQPGAAEQQFAGTWAGQWKGDGFVYSPRMSLQVDAQGNVSGKIEWTLKQKAANRSEYAGKVGLTGVEYVFGRAYGNYLSVDGTKLDDPNHLLGLDKYRLVLSPDGSTLGGDTWTQGRWAGRFQASRQTFEMSWLSRISAWWRASSP